MSFSLQFNAILRKNMILGWRSREILWEILLPLLAGILMCLKTIIIPIQFLAPVVVALAVNASTRALLIRLVEDKNLRHKETQKIMGLSQTAYFLAWYVSGFLRVFVGCLMFLLVPTLIISSNSNIRQCANYIRLPGCPKYPLGFWELNIDGYLGEFFIVYILYGIAAINQSFALSSFFNEAKMAGEIGTFITTLTSLISYLIFTDRFSKHTYLFIVLSIFPQPGIAFAYMIGSAQTVYKQYEVWPTQNVNFTMNDCLVEMIVVSFGYIVLYFYLEQVMPNEYGVSKHPLFFLNFKKKQYNKSLLRESSIHEQTSVQSQNIGNINNGTTITEQLLNKNEDDRTQNNIDVADYSSAIYHEQYEKRNQKIQSVKIDGLKKYFGGTKAVNGISLQLYEGDIFCLLGHNGAGKTTAISVLTGLVSKTDGQVEMYGLDLIDDLFQLRKLIGICNQRDVLYDDLSFEESLEFMGRVKGLSGEALQKDIEYIIEKTKTQDHRKKLVSQLSGGNKRKLSLGQALIGGSKVIFLDEPTSGMDTISRRKIWEILETLKKEERTVVLTTHHLDEAEVLSDRIGIMAKGKLLAVGTNEFIKRNFGVGYHLKLMKEIQNLGDEVKFTLEEKLQLVELVRSKIENCEVNPQSSDDCLVIELPFNQQERFTDLFYALEMEKKIAVNLEMNSLEDAFINIGMEEEKYLESKKEHVEELKADIENKNEAKYTNFADLKKPACLAKPPVYSFWTQFAAIFMRKYYFTVRSISSYVAIIIPLVILIVGCLIITRISDFRGYYAFQMIFLSNFAAVGYAFNCGAYVTLPVLEREHNLKYALNVMGCRVLPYWIGTFVFDLSIFCFTIVIFYLIVALGNIQFVIAYFYQVLALLLLFGFSYIPFSYMCGFMFKASNSALKGFPPFNFFIVYCIPWSILGIFALLHELDYISYDVFWGFGLFFNIIYFFLSPLWVLSLALLLAPGSFQCINNAVYWVSCDWSDYAWILFAQGIFYMLMTYLFEQRRYSLNMDKTAQGLTDIKLEPAEDPGVKFEEDRIKGQQEENKITINGMWKKYENGFVAIKDVTYGVKQGEIFGLLGPNGAGKSTTFNILTSLIPRTVGSVKIKNIEVNKGIMDIYQDVGICPQFDCLWQNLSPPEHLYLFGRMKGLEGNELNQAVRYFLQTMQLTEFMKTKAQRLSGGNKRKLCVANALIGGPDIQFFDEPSTGVDSIARRFLWNTLQQGQKLRNSSMVLTTHQMIEAETLCQKIGILINGRFCCIGSPQQLRNAYGEGYSLSIKLPPKQKELNANLRNEITQNFPSSKELKKKDDELFTFKIPKSEFSFFKAYLTCLKYKQQNIIEDFQLNQASLEQVFVYFSQFQEARNIDDDDNKLDQKDDEYEESSQDRPLSSNQQNTQLDHELQAPQNNLR